MRTLVAADCEPIEQETIEWGNRPAIVALILSGNGFLATLFTLIVFVAHNNTPVVKSSTRELTYIIFLGISSIVNLSLSVRLSLSDAHLTRKVFALIEIVREIRRECKPSYCFLHRIHGFCSAFMLANSEGLDLDQRLGFVTNFQRYQMCVGKQFLHQDEATIL